MMDFNAIFRYLHDIQIDYYLCLHDRGSWTHRHVDCSRGLACRSYESSLLHHDDYHMNSDIRGCCPDHVDNYLIKCVKCELVSEMDCGPVSLILTPFSSFESL